MESVDVDLSVTDSANCSVADTLIDAFENYPPSLLYFASFCFVVYITIGVPGNAVTIIALSRSKRVRNATAAFIINLSVADLMFCMVNLPLAISNFLNRGWVHGDLLCELFPFLRYGNVAVSLLSVMAITVNRFVMIAYPKQYPRLFRPLMMAVMITTIWVVSFGPLLPTWAGLWGRFGFDPRVGTCTILPVEGRTPKSFLFVVAFIIPCLIIIFCYLRIFCVVRRSRSKSRGPNRSTPVSPTSGESTISGYHHSEGTSIITAQVIRTSEHPQFVIPTERWAPPRLVGPAVPKDPLAHGHKRGAAAFAARHGGALGTAVGHDPRDLRLVKMILVIFGAFVLCYLPLTIVKVLAKEEEMPVLNIFSYIVLYLSSCTNPIIYVVVSREYRRAYIDMFTCREFSGMTVGRTMEMSDVSRSIALTMR